MAGKEVPAARRSRSSSRVSTSFSLPLRFRARAISLSRPSSSPAQPPGVNWGSTSAAGRISASLMFWMRRWVSGSKKPMASISSPKNSTRTGFWWAGEKKSRMPPRRANWPTPSTCWHRAYPAAVRVSVRSFRSWASPMRITWAAWVSRVLGMVRWRRASTVHTSRGHSPAASARRTDRRRCSYCRDTTAALWKVNSRADRVVTFSPERAARSFSIRWASPSSAHTTTTGRSSPWWSPAAKWARWTADRPEKATGQAPLSMAASRAQYSGISFRADSSCFMVHLEI